MLVAAVVVAPDAAAKCAMPSAAFEPASGSLPPKPVLRLLAPSYGLPTLPNAAGALPSVSAEDAP